MKLFFLLALTSFLTDPAPIVEWLQPMTIDFGDLQGRDEVQTTFEFRNISDSAIIIEAVRPGCGCTAPDWSEEAIPPDSTAQLVIWYIPKKEGYFKELIKVYFSGQRKAERIYIEGYVVD
ncbi:MAG: DUF1573 domain-containing protein [Saprospiraceae bacterium]|nr:DUF1573 domain-containing protein [Saprospiraceae bacterium]